MTQISDIIKQGDVFYAQAGGRQRGVPPGLLVDTAPPTETFGAVALDYGAIATASTSTIVVAYTATTATVLTATGSLVSGGVATMDVPRSIQVTATAVFSAAETIRAVGTDVYGNALTEDKVLATTTTVGSFTKAFWTITEISTSGALTNPLTVTAANVIGLPIRIANKGKVMGVYVDGVPETTLTVVAGLTTTQVATATNGDTRGTFTPNTASNGTRAFSVNIIVPSRTTADEVYGVTPA